MCNVSVQHFKEQKIIMVSICTRVSMLALMEAWQGIFTAPSLLYTHKYNWSPSSPPLEGEAGDVDDAEEAVQLECVEDRVQDSKNGGEEAEEARKKRLDEGEHGGEEATIYIE
jgi:hypothetical protein